MSTATTARTATTGEATSGKGAAGKATARARGSRSPLASVGLHATLVVASVIAVFPVLWIVLTSLKPAKHAVTTDFVKEPTLSNYTNLLEQSHFLSWFANSVLVAGVTTVLGVFIAATTGYAVSRFKFPGMKPLMWTLLITQMFPMAILIVPLYNLMGDLGLLNQPLGLIITYLTIAVPFCAWMMKGFFDTIPVEIDESAASTGSTPSAPSGASSCRSPSPASPSPASTPSSPPGARSRTPPPSWSARRTSPWPADCRPSSRSTPPTGEP